MGKKILIIDDQIDLVEVLAEQLQKEGYEISSAYNGQDGYDLYARLKPDLIILDIGLPKINGYEVCRRIRRQDKDEKTFIIMLTAKAEEEDRIVGKVMGAEVYITKPFEITELLRTVKMFLARQ